MKYAFLGTTEFSALILKALLKSSYPPSLVICNPDRPAGRKKTLTPPPVKPLAESSGIPVLQPEHLDDEFISKFREENLDLSLLASYGKILPASFLKASGRGVIGVHVSLLPRHRGASPMQTAILEGDELTGVSLYLMDEKVDHGPILAEAEIAVGRRNFLELQEESARIAGELLLRILPDFMAGRIQPRTQDESKATYTRKFRTEDAFVDPSDLDRAVAGDGPLAQKIDRMIRAFHPEPGAWTMKEGKRLKVLRADLEGKRLVLRTIQWEGKKPEEVTS